MFLPRIYPITDPRLTKLSHAEQVKRLIDGGAQMIQLREKYGSPKDFYESAKEAIKIARPSSVRIIINDRVDIALAAGAGGVHLGQDDLPPARAREILGENAIIGFSTHNPEQAARAVKLPIDYLAIGPVFATATKENAEEPLGIEGVKRVREAIGNFPMVAIGGITFENFREIISAGANSVAIINNLLFDPASITKNMKKFSI
ncbi:MAG: thiamine phosphate synthase [Acidobacteriota bacterium]|jgi:thiamine-phosphate pyrophosphorylase|nr:thiamine phosphate synthase [Acidobacteriota bacterium]